MLTGSGSWTESDTRTIVERCSERSGGVDVLSAVGTRDAARDMDVLRAALGDDRLTFLGHAGSGADGARDACESWPAETDLDYPTPLVSGDYPTRSPSRSPAIRPRPTTAA